MDEQQKNIVRDTITGALIGTGTALWQEMTVFSPEGKKLSIIGRDTFIGGLIGGAIGFVAGLIFYGKRTSKTEFLTQEKATENRDTARTL